MTTTVGRLAIARDTDADRPNYRLADADTGEAVARVDWLNVAGAPFAFGGSADDVCAEFGGEHVARVDLVNRADGVDAVDGVPVAAGARIRLDAGKGDGVGL